ncbi:hypothetical protein [Deinococcus multiflagellatus]|uniref:Lipoprotein n=2 Tax=Deinococcus multiflagellatus TaxID=1656887 RepID=A0ABW1ZEW0_9DEIO
MKKVSTTVLGLTVLLSACGQSTPQGQSPAAARSGSLQAQATTATVSACSALYASGPSGVQVDSSMRYGQVGTLILAFADDTSKGRAITWMDSTLPVDPGNGLGAFENLPMIALKTLVTQELVAQLQANLPGLVSIYQDAP